MISLSFSTALYALIWQLVCCTFDLEPWFTFGLYSKLAGDQDTNILSVVRIGAVFVFNRKCMC